MASRARSRRRLPPRFCTAQLNLVNKYLGSKQSVGAMVVTFKLGEQPCYFSRGEIAVGSGVAPDANTIFELASITKVFTTAILGMRAWQDLYAWGPVKPYLTTGYALSSREKDVTFQQLATFTGGFDWDDPPGFNSTVSYSQNDFVTAVNNVPKASDNDAIQVGTDLPTFYSYSNGSVGFLGQILMNMDSKNGESYPFSASGFSKWISANLTGPLNMTNTKVEPGGVWATGYAISGMSSMPYNYVPPFLWQPWGAAGALRSNATDMLKFLQANICAYHFSDPNCIGLPQKVLDGLSTAHFPNAYSPAGTRPDPIIYIGNGTQVEQAWAWRVRQPPVPNPDNLTSITSKDGGHPGFSTWIGFSPHKAYGLVILMNTGGGGLINIGEAIIDNAQ